MKAARSVELGTNEWKLVGCVGGFALVTRWTTEQSLWLDLRQWPAELGRSLKGWARSVAIDRDGRIAALVGWSAQTAIVYAPGFEKKTEIPLPAGFGFRAIGFVGGLLVAIPGNVAAEGLSSELKYPQIPVLHDGHEWIPVPGLRAGAGGAEAWEQSGTAQLAGGYDWVIWHGRIYEWGLEQLVDATSVDLGPNSGHSVDTMFVPVGEAMYAVADDRLVRVSRGASAIDRVGPAKRRVTAIAAYGRQIVVTGGAQTWLFDPATGKEVELDTKALGKDHGRVFGAPAGLVALVANGGAIASLRS